MPDTATISAAARLVHRLRHLCFRLLRPMTLGAQGVVLDGQGRVFLVRHTYVPGWHFPGGGVEAGESVAGALARELREEGNIALDAPPVLHGIFHNTRFSRRDHVAVLVARQFHQTGPRAPDIEIAATGFFACHALPEGATTAVRARLAEILDGAALSERW